MARDHPPPQHRAGFSITICPAARGGIIRWGWSDTRPDAMTQARQQGQPAGLAPEPVSTVVRTGRDSRQPTHRRAPRPPGKKQDVLVAVCIVFEGRDTAGVRAAERPSAGLGIADGRAPGPAVPVAPPRRPSRVMRAPAVIGTLGA